MKHRLRRYDALRYAQYEALAFAPVKQSALFAPHVPKARFIAKGDFILHTPSGALHSTKQKTTRSGGFLFGGDRGDRTPDLTDVNRTL